MAEDNKKSLDVLTQEMKKVNQNLTWASEISSDRLDTIARLQTSGINSIRAMYDDSKKTQVDLAKKVEENTEAIKNSNDTSAEDRVEEKRDKKGFLDSLKTMFAKKADDKEGGNFFGGIGKTVKKVFSLIKFKFLAIGALVLGAISQMNMEDLEDIWESFKKSWKALKKFMKPIIEWFEKTALPGTIIFIKEQFENIATMFEGIQKHFEGWSEKNGKEKFMSILGVFGTIGDFAMDTAASLMDWGARLFGYEGSLSKDIKKKWEEFFGPTAKDGILSKITGLVSSISGLFLLGKIIGGPIGSFLTAPLKLAIMGAKGAGGLIGGLAKSIGSAMIGPGGGGVASVGKLLMGAAKGVGILGLAAAVGTGLYKGYKTFEKTGSISKAYEEGMTSFLEVMTAGLLPDGMARSWAKSINGFFGSIYDAMFGDKQKELSVKEIKELRELKSGKKYAQMSQDERNAEQAKLIKSQNERRAKGDVGGGAGEYIAPQKTTDEKIEKAKRKLRNLQSQLARNSKGKQTATSVKVKARILKEIETQKGVLDFYGEDKGRTFSEAEQIQKDEGFREGVYKDTEGIDTIGYGFNLERKNAQKLLDSKGIKKSVADLRSGKANLTEEEASQLMLGEMGHFRSVAEQYIGSDVWKKLSPNRKGILTNMAYNMGAGGLGTFQQLRKAIRAGDWDEAQKQMSSSKWAGQVKGRADRLVARMGGDQKTNALNSTQAGFTASQGGPAGTPVIYQDNSSKVNQVSSTTDVHPSGNAQGVGAEGALSKGS